MNLHTYKQIRRIEILKANRAKIAKGKDLYSHSVRLQEQLVENQEAIMRQSERLGSAQNAQLELIADQLGKLTALKRNGF